MRIGRDVRPDDPRYGTYLYGSNLWPHLPENEFKQPIMKYREHVLQLAREIMKILAKGLPHGNDVFDDFMQDPVASVKLLHYPPQPLDGKIRLGGMFLNSAHVIPLYLLCAPSWRPHRLWSHHTSSTASWSRGPRSLASSE